MGAASGNVGDVTMAQERLQKIIAAAGLTARRDAEKWLEDGRVTVNGVRAKPGDKADPELDLILVDGEPLPDRPAKVYLMLHKPRGYVTTMHDEKGRKSVAELIRDVPARVYPVGRLDMDSEGLLLFTNDGEFANALMHPSREKRKIYFVQTAGDLDAALPVLRSPLNIDGYTIRPAQIRRLDGQCFEICIHEGRNRQIRKMCSLAGLRVLKLRRIEEDGIQLGDLQPGKWRYLTAREIKGCMQNSLQKCRK